MELATDVTNLTPLVAISNLATYTQLGAKNFSNPVNYVVTAQDGVTQKTYTVTVQLVDMKFYGSYPYETIFPTGYLIPDWMSSPTAKNTIATLTYNVNLNVPTKISINTLETTSGVTLGYLKIEAPIGDGLAQTQLPGIMFDGKIIHNNKHLNLQVFDATGQMVLSSNQNILMNTNPEGIYLVKSSAGILKIVLLK